MQRRSGTTAVDGKSTGAGAARGEEGPKKRLETQVFEVSESSSESSFERTKHPKISRSKSQSTITSSQATSKPGTSQPGKRGLQVSAQI